MIKAIGTGMNSCDRIINLIKNIPEDFLDVIMLAGRFTLLEQTALEELFILCSQKDIRVMIAGPLNSGILTGDPQKNIYNYQPADNLIKERRDKIAAVCKEHDVTIRHAAIKFLSLSDSVVSIVSGMRNEKEIIDNVKSLNTPVPEKLWDALIQQGLMHKSMKKVEQWQDHFINSHIRVNLTHNLHPEIPHWGTESTGVTIENVINYKEAGFRAQKICMFERSGTHIDFPAHKKQDGKTAEHYSTQELIAPCVVIDISQKASDQYEVTVDDIKVFEKKFGKIPEASFVLFNFGWGEKYWRTDRKKYCDPNYFPSVSLAAGQYILDNAKPKGLGSDTPSVDNNLTFPLHQLYLEKNNLLLIENLNNLSELPARDALIELRHLRIMNAPESPTVAIGIYKNKNYQATLFKISRKDAAEENKLSENLTPTLKLSN